MMARMRTSHTVHPEAHAVCEQVATIVDPVPLDEVPRPIKTNLQSLHVSVLLLK